MPGYYWRVSFNQGGISILGNADLTSTPDPYWYFSPLGLLTQGFIYGLGDIWFDLDPGTIQQVTWTDVDDGC